MVQTKPRQELRARENLTKQDYEVYMPHCLRERMVGETSLFNPEPLFPMYLFVRLSRELDDWGPIRSTLGVRKLVRFGDQSPPVPDGLIDHLKQAEARRHGRFNAGDVLQIRSGPLKGLEGVYDVDDGQQRAFVLIQIMNRVARISLQRSALERL